jgi:hypothetical protein
MHALKQPTKNAAPSQSYPQPITNTNASSGLSMTKCGADCGNGTALDYFTSSIVLSTCSSNPGKPFDIYTFEGRLGPVFKGLKIRHTPFKTIGGVLTLEACYRECVNNFIKGGLNPLDKCRSFNYNSNFKDCYLLNLEASRNPRPVPYCKDPAISSGYHDAT